MKSTTKRPAAAKTTKASKDTPAPRCELCGRRCVARADGQAFTAHGLCASCLTGTGRKTA